MTVEVDRSDLIKTINENDEIVGDDDSSDEEDVAQPKKNKAARKTNESFEPGFSFVSSHEEYMHDTWNDIAKYIKKKNHSNVDEKIDKLRQDRTSKEKGVVEVDSEESSEELSDDEMVEDAVKVKKA